MKGKERQEHTGKTLFWLADVISGLCVTEYIKELATTIIKRQRFCVFYSIKCKL